MRKRLLFACILLFCLALALFAACGKNPPVKIEVVTFPDSVKVILGNDLDLTGGTVAVCYEDGSEEIVDMSELEVRGFKSDVLGAQTVVLVYEEKGKIFSATLEVNVVRPQVKRLELSLEGVKTNYIEGEDFDDKNLVVTACYSSGDSLKAETYEIQPRTLSSTTTSVRISYGGAVAAIPVTVVKKAPEALRIATLPSKTSFFVGEDFSANGLTAMILYNDGDTLTLSGSALTYTHPNGSEYRFPIDLEDDVIVVKASTTEGTAETTMKITVKEVLPLSLAVTMNRELIFAEGDRFSFGEEEESVSVLVRYNNGKEETLIADRNNFSCSDDYPTADCHAVTIWLTDYEEVTAQVPITVRVPVLRSIDILTNPDKTIYSVGEEVDLSGLTILLIMDNDGYDSLEYAPSSGITATPSVIAEDTQTITVSYLGYTVSYGIVVYA